MHSPVHSRALHIAFLLGACAFVLNSLLGAAKVRRDRRQQRQALQTWEGEGGALPNRPALANRPDGAAPP
jgi:hypothetical protein